jgi:hypothetical protein
MRITVEGRTYDVEVEVLDEAGNTPPQHRPHRRSNTAPTQAPAATPSSRPTTAARRNRRRRSATGDLPSPIAGNVLDVKVKPGDQVAVDDHPRPRGHEDGVRRHRPGRRRNHRRGPRQRPATPSSGQALVKFGFAAT